MRLKVEVSAPSAEIQQDVCERTKKKQSGCRNAGVRREGRIERKGSVMK